MKRVLTLAVLVASFAASAQVLSPLTIRRVDDPNIDTYTFGAAQCSTTLTVRWQYNTNIGTLCSSLRLWSTDGTCGDAAGTNDVKYDDVPAITVTGIRSGTFSVKISELPAFAKADTTTPCGGDRISKTHTLCGSIDYSTVGCGFSTALKLSASPLKLVYDTLPPTAPTITGLQGQDGAIKVEFTHDSDTTVVIGEVKGPSDTDFSYAGEAAASTGFVRLTRLNNGDTYDVRLRGKDASDNISDPSDIASATPVRTVGFFGVLREKGSSEQGGGCSVGGPLMPLGLLALARALARRRTR